MLMNVILRDITPGLQKDDLSFLPGFFKDCGIRKTLQMLLAQVDDLVSMYAERLDRAHGDTDICQTSRG